MSARAVARGAIVGIAAALVLAVPAWANDDAHKMAEKFAGQGDGADGGAVARDRGVVVREDGSGATGVLIDPGAHLAHPEVELTVAVGERMGLIGALSIETARSYLGARDIDGVVIGDGFNRSVVEDFMEELNADPGGKIDMELSLRLRQEIAPVASFRCDGLSSVVREHSWDRRG